MKTESKFETHSLLAKHLKTSQFNRVNLFDELIENLFHSILKWPLLFMSPILDKKSENCGNRYMSKLFEKSMLLIIQSIDISAKHFVFSRIVSNGT